MKKWFFLFLSASLAFTACKKDKDTAGCTYTQSSTVATPAEIDSLGSYLSHQGISTIQDSSGVFYSIDSLGSGLTPGLCSNMTVEYKCILLKNDKVVDSTATGQTTVMQLGGLIVGWQKIMPMIKAGSRVTLYIPPTLGYGATTKRNGDGDVIIPAYSYLKFNIWLVSFQ